MVWDPLGALDHLVSGCWTTELSAFLLHELCFSERLEPLWPSHSSPLIVRWPQLFLLCRMSSHHSHNHPVPPSLHLSFPRALHVPLWPAHPPQLGCGDGQPPRSLPPEHLPRQAVGAPTREEAGLGLGAFRWPSRPSNLDSISQPGHWSKDGLLVEPPVRRKDWSLEPFQGSVKSRQVSWMLAGNSSRGRGHLGTVSGVSATFPRASCPRTPQTPRPNLPQM